MDHLKVFDREDDFVPKDDLCAMIPVARHSLPEDARIVGFIARVAGNVVAVYAAQSTLWLEVNGRQWNMMLGGFRCAHNVNGSVASFEVAVGGKVEFSVQYSTLTRAEWRQFEITAILSEWPQDDYEWLDLFAWAAGLASDDSWKAQLLAELPVADIGSHGK